MLFCRHYSDYMWLDRSYLRLSVVHRCPSDNGPATRWDAANRSGCGVCFQLTLVVQLSSVFLPALQAHPLPKQIQKLLERRPRALIVVHVFLWALPSPAVHHTNLSLEIQLRRQRNTDFIIIFATELNMHIYTIFLFKDGTTTFHLIGFLDHLTSYLFEEFLFCKMLYTYTAYITLLDL